MWGVIACCSSTLNWVKSEPTKRQWALIRLFRPCFTTFFYIMPDSLGQPFLNFLYEFQLSVMLNWPLQETLLNGCVALQLECHNEDLWIISIHHLGEILTWIFKQDKGLLKKGFKCERELVRCYYCMLMTDRFPMPLYCDCAQKGTLLLGSV